MGPVAVIRSETQVALSDDLTEHYVRSPLVQRQEAVILRTRRRNYPIRIENFAKHSEKMRTLYERKELPPAIDLSSYNVDAVRTLTDFLAGIDQRNLRVDENYTSDLLQLARIFRMPDLTDFVISRILKKVEMGNITALILAMELASSDWSLFLNADASYSLVQVAAENIGDVITSTLFLSLPAAVLVALFNKCEIPISDYQISQVAVAWLKATTRTEEEAEVLFSCVRTPLLSKKEREMIRDKAKDLPPRIVKIIEKTLDSARNHRCCVMKSHIDQRYARCGIPSDQAYERVDPINVTTKLTKSSSQGRRFHEAKKAASDVSIKRDRTKHKAISLRVKKKCKACMERARTNDEQANHDKEKHLRKNDYYKEKKIGERGKKCTHQEGKAKETQGEGSSNSETSLSLRYR